MQYKYYTDTTIATIATYNRGDDVADDNKQTK